MEGVGMKKRYYLLMLIVVLIGDLHAKNIISSRGDLFFID